jgi:hypothetical protein
VARNKSIFLKTFLEGNCNSPIEQKEKQTNLPKIGVNHPSLHLIDKTHVKGTNNGAKDVSEGLFRAVGV